MLRRAAVWRGGRSLSYATSKPSPPPEALLNEVSSGWEGLLTTKVKSSLLRDGFCVLPRAFPPAFTKVLREEMTFLHDTQQMYPNSTHILLKDEQEPMLLEKHHIMETELVLPEVRRQVPNLEWFFDSQLVFAGLRGLLPSWLDLSGYMIKLQYNEGQGGCFPMHFDTYGDDGKCLTAVLYLNENWQEGDGGEIVVYPFPRNEPVTIRPLDGDLVLFSSQQMLHRVMPAVKPRFCLTTWMYQGNSNTNDPARNTFYQPKDQEPNYLSDVLHKVMRSSFRRHLAKLYYHEEWSRSLQQSHQQTSAFEKYADTQEREVQVIKDATTKMLHNFRVKDKKQPSTLPQSSEVLLEKITTDDQYRQILSKMPIPWF